MGGSKRESAWHLSTGSMTRPQTGVLGTQVVREYVSTSTVATSLARHRGQQPLDHTLGHSKFYKEQLGMRQLQQIYVTHGQSCFRAKQQYKVGLQIHQVG